MTKKNECTCSCNDPNESEKPSERTNRLQQIRKDHGELPTQESIDSAKKILAKVQRSYLRLPGVTAVDLGLRVQEGEDKFTNELAIRLHVAEKVHRDSLESRGLTDIRDLVEKVSVQGIDTRRGGGGNGNGNDESKAVTKGKGKGKADLEDESKKDQGPVFMSLSPKDGSDADTTGDELRPDTAMPGEVRLDIVQGRYFPTRRYLSSQELVPNRNLDDDELSRLSRARIEPLVGGVSIGGEGGGAGTAGAIVWDELDGTPAFLTCAHVVAPRGFARVGGACYQPALYDGGDADRDRAATLRRWIFDQRGDAAIAQLDSNRYYSPGDQLGLWESVTDAIEPRLGMRVRKFGRSTGFTHGFIDGICLTACLKYPKSGIRCFVNQLHIAPLYAGDDISQPGDSGCLWVYCSPEPKGDETADGEETAEGAGTGGGEDKPPELGENANAKEPTSGAETPEELRRYYAVGLHFAGDSAASPYGEYAVATPCTQLAEDLKFSFRPVFAPAESYVVEHDSAPQGIAGGPNPGILGRAGQGYPGGPQPEDDPIG